MIGRKRRGACRCILAFSATYYCFNKYFTLKETNPNEGKIEFTTDVHYYVNLYQTWLVLGACSQRKCCNNVSELLLLIIVSVLYECNRQRYRVCVHIADSLLLLRMLGTCLSSFLSLLIMPHSHRNLCPLFLRERLETNLQNCLVSRSNI